MKFLIAPDSFKGSLTAKEAARAMARGVRQAIPDADLVLVPMADGGEGTVQTLVAATNGKLVAQRVRGPLPHQLVTAHYGLLGDGQTAVIEMAEASGIGSVTPTTMNPLVTTTYGTGELIRAALDRGVTKIIIGIGGSATVDGGAGMAQALGARLLDAAGHDLPAGGGALGDLARIDVSGLDPRLAKVTIEVASDVTNPLTGPTGAAVVFGPQKGATPAMVTTLDANLHHYAQVIKDQLGRDLEQAPGAGAAGGLGIGLLAFTPAKLVAGVDLVLAATGLADQARGADYVLTGEGSVDSQTQYGKVPIGVAKTVKAVVPAASVIIIAGRIGPGADELYQTGLVDAIFASPTGAKPLAVAMRDAAADLTTTAAGVARLIKKIDY